MSKTAAAATAKAVSPATFEDQAFKSRTIVLPDGRAFDVEKRRIVATDPALIEYLANQPDFRRLEG